MGQSTPFLFTTKHPNALTSIFHTIPGGTPTFIFNIGKHAKLLESSKALMNDLLVISGEIPGRKDLNFYRAGPSSEKAYLLALVILPVGVLGRREARVFAERMKGVVDGYGLSEVEVAFRELAVYPQIHPSSPKPEICRGIDYLNVEAASEVGTSLGYHGLETVGTFGMSINIDGLHEGTYFLTTCNVALPNEWNVEVGSSIAENIKNVVPKPYSMVANPGVAHYIDQPAVIDLAELKKILTSMQKKYIQDLESFRTCGEFEHSEGKLDEKVQRVLGESDKNNERLEKLKTISLRLGRVAFTSGRRFGYPPKGGRDGITLDWALIEPDPKRFPKNPISERDVLTAELRADDSESSIYGSHKNPMPAWKIPFDSMMEWNAQVEAEKSERFLSSSNSFRIDLKDTRNIMQDINDGRSVRVIKRGRHSGYTLGVLNEVMTVVQYSIPERNEELRTMELSVCNLNDRTFSKRGDSGSVVFDQEGHVLGLLHEIRTDEGFGSAVVTYLTPINEVFKDIAEMTNAKSVKVNPTDPKQ